DQWIFLDRKLKVGTASVYTVKDERSLYEVSQASGVLIKYLEAYNGIKSNATLVRGKRILLQPGHEAPLTEEVAPKKVHSVLPKEGLYNISKKYNVSVAEIKSWNSLESDNLKVGQQLIILK
ncbi:MAG: LysM peptidoglycan-binding domain-containing protein, partial [Ferruginibacter sp.]